MADPSALDRTPAGVRHSLSDIDAKGATLGHVATVVSDGTGGQTYAPQAPSGGGSGAPTSAQYVTLATDATLTNERVLTAGTGITITDGGAGNAVTIAATGGGGGGSYTFLDPDKPNGSEGSGTDEFTDPGASNTYNARWTAQPNWSGLTAYDVNLTIPGQLWCTFPSNSLLLRCLLQALPAGDFTIATQVMLPQYQVAYALAGLVLSSTNTAGTGSQATVSIFADSADIGRSIDLFTNFNALSSTPYRKVHQETELVIAIRRSGSTYTAEWSTNGRTVVQQTFTPTSPAYMGIVVSGAIAGVQASFKHFRYYNSATVALGAMRTI